MLGMFFKDDFLAVLDFGLATNDPQGVHAAGFELPATVDTHPRDFRGLALDAGDHVGLLASAALQAQFSGLDVGAGGLDHDSTGHEEFVGHAGVDLSEFDGVLLGDYLELPLVEAALDPSVFREYGLELEHPFLGLFPDGLIDGLIEGLEMHQLDGQERLPRADVLLDPEIVDLLAQQAEFLQEGPETHLQLGVRVVC
jgi:hypothetical protein